MYLVVIIDIFTRELALAGLVIENGHHHHQHRFKLHTKMKILLDMYIKNSQMTNCIHKSDLFVNKQLIVNKKLVETNYKK